MYLDDVKNTKMIFAKYSNFEDLSNGHFNHDNNYILNNFDQKSQIEKN